MKENLVSICEKNHSEPENNPPHKGVSLKPEIYNWGGSLWEKHWEKSGYFGGGWDVKMTNEEPYH